MASNANIVHKFVFDTFRYKFPTGILMIFIIMCSVWCVGIWDSLKYELKRKYGSKDSLF